MIRKLFLATLSVLALNIWVAAQENALFPIDKNRKAGYIDHTGKVVIPLKFDEAWPFSEGLAPVRIGEDWGYINIRGDFVIKPQFFEAWTFNGGRARVGIYWKERKIIDSRVGEYYYIDSRGRVLKKDASGDSEFFFGRKLFQTEGNMPNSRTGYSDETGKTAIKPTFLYGREFSEGLACVLNDQGAGFIDIHGTTQIAFSYKQCGGFSEGLASILVDGLVGFIDKSGKIVIKPQFEWVPGAETRFSDGVAVVKVAESKKPLKMDVRDVRIDASRNMYATESGLFGVIDRTGNFIIEPKYVQIGDFQNGLAWVNLGKSYLIHGDTDRWGYINKAGKIVWKSF